MVQWVEKIAFLLLAIYNLIWEQMKAGDYMQIDETPVKVLDPEVKGKAATGYLWFYSVPNGDALLEFAQSRGQEAPRKRLQGFQGTIQSDAYEVYNALKRERPRTLQRIGCLAHARRKFYKAVAESSHDAIWFIGHPDAGWRSAVIYTIILSCRRRGINPQKYLSDVLARLPSMTSNQV